MRTTDTHVFFWGSFLSNFYYAPFDVAFEGETLHFKSSEQAYMASKALFFGDSAAFRKILDAFDAREAKAIGRTVNNFDAIAWDEVSYEAMFSACVAKFANNIIIREKLIETGDLILVEASPLDCIWGVGLHEDDDLILNEKNWKGENRLGKVLMEVRSFMKESFPNE